MKDRNLHVDTLRGLACLLLVSFHVVGYTPQIGLQVTSGLYRDLNDFLSYLRMPLFTFLSGLVYAYRPFFGDAPGFIKGKARRLLLPMLVVGTLFALVQLATPGTNGGVDNWYLLHILPVGHFWFLQAIFIIFMLMIPLELLGAFRSPTRFFWVLLGASLVFVSGLRISYFSISGAIYLFPFFLLGMGCYRFGWIRDLKLSYGLLALALAGLGLFLSVQGVVHGDTHSALGLVLGALGCIGLLSLRLESRWLAHIGVYSYAIYLYHVFFTAGTRITLSGTGVTDIHTHFALGMLAGILGPILVDQALSKSNITRITLLGKSKTKTRPPQPAEPMIIEATPSVEH